MSQVNSIFESQGAKETFLSFEATWWEGCTACQPAINGWAKKYNIPFLTAWDDRGGQSIFSHYGVNTMPTIWVFNNGKKSDGVTGCSEDRIEQMIKAHLDGKNVTHQ
jgi:thioredoxin-like negative regulator of GroEL